MAEIEKWELQTCGRVLANEARIRPQVFLLSGSGETVCQFLCPRAAPLAIFRVVCGKLRHSKHRQKKGYHKMMDALALQDLRAQHDELRSRVAELRRFL